jgi:hypothetical protein
MSMTARRMQRTPAELRTSSNISAASRGIPANCSKRTHPQHRMFENPLQQNDKLHLKTIPLLQWIAAVWTGHTLSKRPPGMHKRRGVRQSWATVEDQGVQCRALIEQRRHAARPKSEPEKLRKIEITKSPKPRINADRQTSVHRDNAHILESGGRRKITREGNSRRRRC